MKLPKSFTKVTPLSKALAMILFVILPFTGFYFGLKYQKLLDSGAVVQENLVTKTETSQNCPEYGYGQKTEFLKRYTVKPGDTILSISKNQLGGPSRVNELITLNKENYPSLSMASPFLEQDWVLFLPPDYVKASSGKIVEDNGNLQGVGDPNGTWQISGPTATFSTLKVTPNTKLPISKINNGQCVKAVVDDQTGEIFSIVLQ